MWLCGCVSTKQVRNQSLEVAKFDIEKFNGDYVNKADFAKDFYANEPLFRQLFSGTLMDRYPKNIHITDSTIVNFYFDNKKTLIITATERGKILYKKKLRGKVKGNYFSVRRKLFLVPIPCIYFHDETKILLGNDKNGNLILKLGDSGGFWLFIMAASTEYISQSQFKKFN